MLGSDNGLLAKYLQQGALCVLVSHSRDKCKVHASRTRVPYFKKKVGTNLSVLKKVRKQRNKILA